MKDIGARGRIAAIAVKEFREAARSGALPALACAAGLLFLTAVVVGWHSHARALAERKSYQDLVRAQWEGQPARHPHRVSHYGTFAFRPRSALGFFDPGIDSFTGGSLYLEAHKQNTANFSEARHSTGMLRFGELTAAMILQALAPLFIFFTAFAAFTREREAGTLPLLFCQGVSGRELLIGKVLGAGLSCGAVLGPILGASALLLLAKQGFLLNGDALLRVLLLTGAYALYFVLWVFLAVLISAGHRHSRGALMTLLSLWAFLFILMPRALPNLARRMFPSPSKPEFDRALRLEVQKGGDGHDPKDVHFAKMKQALLDKHGVKKVEDLPFNFAGVAMQAGEEHSSRVFEKHFGALQDTFRNQNALAEWAAIANPYLAIRHLSMSLSGTDHHHYADFLRASEAFRYDFVRRLNDLHTHEIDWKTDREQQVAAERWSRFPEFSYQAPPTAWALAHQPMAAAGLVVWALGLGWAARRMRIRPL